jgi:hypothetical protein
MVWREINRQYKRIDRSIYLVDSQHNVILQIVWSEVRREKRQNLGAKEKEDESSAKSRENEVRVVIGF